MSLLLVHGVGGRPHVWKRVLDLLDPALRRDVQVADVRPTAGQSINAIARQLLDSHRGSHVIVGHSLGGMLAQEAALIDRQRVIGLVLVSSIPGANSGVAAHNEALAADIENRGITVVADEFAERLFAPGRTTRKPWLKTEFVDDMVESGGPSVCAALRAIARWDASQHLQALTCPSEVLGGDAEPDLDRQRHLATLLGAPFSVVADTGHLAVLESPVIVSRAIERVSGRADD